MASIDCGTITHAVASGNKFSGSFTTETPAAWKAACKYYSGDSKCKPHTFLTNLVTVYSDIGSQLNSDFDKNFPSISGKGVSSDTWQTDLKLCEDIQTITPPANCADIDYKTIRDDYVGNLDTQDARCTEIGYYYDMKCKSNIMMNACEDATCNELKMYTSVYTGSNYIGASAEFCRGLNQCMTTDEDYINSTHCENFIETNVDKFKFKHLENTGLSLTQISKKCDEIGAHFDFDKYIVNKGNFQNVKSSVCDQNVIDFEGQTELEKCEIIGALQGKVTKYSDSSGCLELTGPVDCTEVSFTLPVSYDHEGTTDKINVNPVYKNDLSGDFGKYLCQKVGCTDVSQRREDGVYLCKPKHKFVTLCNDSSNDDATKCASAAGTQCIDGSEYYHKCFWDGHDCLDQCPPTPTQPTSTPTQPTSGPRSTDGVYGQLLMSFISVVYLIM